MFWTFEIIRFRADYCVTLEITFDEDDVTPLESGDMENRKETRFGAILVSSSLKDSFRVLSPEIYRRQ